METILFVCTGNTCRSPMAAAVLQSYIAAAGGAGHWRAASAGIMAHDGEAAAVNAVLAARQAGLDLSAHRARQLTSSIAAAAAWIFTMTPQHKAAVLAQMPELAARTCTIHEYAGTAGEITDPYGGDLARYAACMAELRECMRGVWQRLSKDWERRQQDENYDWL